MDKYLSASASTMSKKLNKKLNPQEASATPSSLRSRTKVTDVSAQAVFSSQLNTQQDMLSPDLPAREEPSSPHWSTPSSPGASTLPDQAQAVSVAQAVSDILMPMLDRKLDLLHVSINSALSQITNMTQRVGEMETRIAAAETDLTTSQRTVDSHETILRQLQDKIDDLENRSRRCNLRFVGIPETIKGEDLSAFIAKDLTAALGLTFPQDPPLIERAHRIGGALTTGGNRPRPTIAKFFHYITKEKSLQAFRSQRTLMVRNCKILVFQDFSAAVTAKRKLFNPTCKYLVDHDIRFQLQYPARLRVTENGQVVTYTDPTTAEAHFLRDAPPHEGDP